MFGTAVEADLEKAGEKAKKPKAAEQARMRTLVRWLGTDAMGFRQSPIAPTR